MLFTFPSRYLFTIGLSGVFSLTGWSRQIQTGFHVPRPTQEHFLTIRLLHVRDYHPLWFNFPDDSTSNLIVVNEGPTTPYLPKQVWFGLFPVRSPLLRESLLFSFPPGTEMFQFPGFAPPNGGDRPSDGRVSPFGNPRIKGCLHLPVAYRSLPRPSSPPRAKASVICSLDT